MARIPGLFGAAWLLGLGQGITSAAASGYVLTNAFPGVAFTNPVCITSPPNDTNRLFIVEKRGRVIVITNLAAPTRAIFLDLNTRVSSSFDDTAVGDELGLMGMVFHPGYATNGYFYLFYTGNAVSPAGTGLHDILSRFKVSASDSNQGDSASEIRYMIQFDRAGNHNGS